MKSKGPPPEAIRKAASPESRAKAVATLKRRRAQQVIPLDAIPDREGPAPKRKYTKRTREQILVEIIQLLLKEI